MQVNFTLWYSSATVVKTKRSVDVAAVGGISEATEKPESTETETDEWSQNQQKLLELGIKKYGKDVVDRWDKIAEEVVGKDKVWNETINYRRKIFYHFLESDFSNIQ